MISSSSPYTENFNENENLLYTLQQSNQQNINSKLFFIESENNSSENKFILSFLFYLILVPICIIEFLYVTNVPISVIRDVKISLKILSRSLGAITSLILLIISNNKIGIIKDKSNNKIIIKEINFLCFSKKIIKIDF